jgi:hypothetical protein
MQFGGIGEFLLPGLAIVDGAARLETPEPIEITRAEDRAALGERILEPPIQELVGAELVEE